MGLGGLFGWVLGVSEVILWGYLGGGFEAV